MSNTLTGTRVRNSYTQLLHIAGGPEATEKPVVSASGVPTALSLGTGSASVGNIRLQGNQITPIVGALQLGSVQILGGSISGIDPLPVASGGTGAGTAALARQNLGLGGLAVQDPASIVVTGGSISGATFSGVFASTVSLAQVSDLRRGVFFSLASQLLSADVATPVAFSDAAAGNVGVALVSSTAVEVATAGVYAVTARLQLLNGSNADHDVTFWFRRAGVDIAASASTVTVPKLSDGGAMIAYASLIESLSPGQPLSMAWATEHADLSLGYAAAKTTPFVAPATPSVVLTMVRIG
jgi:hypothetical protein